MNRSSKVFVAGHKGMVGSAVLRALERNGFSKLLVRDRGELDLTRQQAVADFFAVERPEYVFLAAAKVGGIVANNDYPADFILDNLQIQNNVIDSAYRSGCKKLLFLGSSCIYPRLAPQPMSESAFLTSELEPTNQAYAIAKIAGIEMSRAYRRQYGFDAISAMPTNLYGPGDNFNLESSHVVPALIRKFHEAKFDGRDVVVVWGTGKPRREFLHVDDLAEALVFLMNRYSSDEHINIGVGSDVSIAELAKLISEIVGFSGKIRFDADKPDGTPRKLLDVSRLTALGWRASTPLNEGLAETYRWFLANESSIRR